MQSVKFSLSHTYTRIIIIIIEPIVISFSYGISKINNPCCPPLGENASG